MQVKRFVYIPTIGVQKCKTSRCITFKSSVLNNFKQSAFFIKYSVFDNQLWGLNDSNKNVSESIIKN